MVKDKIMHSDAYPTDEGKALITIKAERAIIRKIKEIALIEERTIQTITNRILRRGIDLYIKEQTDTKQKLGKLSQNSN
jgi:hypothetical protein